MVSDEMIHRAFRTHTTLKTKPIRENFNFHHLPKLYTGFKIYICFHINKLKNLFLSRIQSICNHISKQFGTSVMFTYIFLCTFSNLFYKLLSTECLKKKLTLLNTLPNEKCNNLCFGEHWPLLWLKVWKLGCANEKCKTYWGNFHMYGWLKVSSIIWHQQIWK